MDEILRNPVKIVMIIFLLAMVIPSGVALIVGWKKACKEARERNKEDGK